MSEATSKTSEQRPPVPSAIGSVPGAPPEAELTSPANESPSNTATSTAGEDSFEQEIDDDLAHATDIFWSWTSRDRTVVAGLMGLVLILLLIHWIRLSRFGTHSVEVSRMEGATLNFRMNVNEATWVELAQLPGIGETLARRIVEYREIHGNFQSVSELTRVSGIGERQLKLLEGLLETTPTP